LAIAGVWDETYEDLDAEDFLDLVYGKKNGLDRSFRRRSVNTGFLFIPSGQTRRVVYSPRIDSSLRDGENLYFSVAMFSQRGRNYEDCTAQSGWLWADLDEVHPAEAGKNWTPCPRWPYSRQSW
jgi:hypothetical protein